MKKPTLIHRFEPCDDRAEREHEQHHAERPAVDRPLQPPVAVGIDEQRDAEEQRPGARVERLPVQRRAARVVPRDRGDRDEPVGDRRGEPGEQDPVEAAQQGADRHRLSARGKPRARASTVSIAISRRGARSWWPACRSTARTPSAPPAPPRCRRGRRSRSPRRPRSSGCRSDRSRTTRTGSGSSGCGIARHVRRLLGGARLARDRDREVPEDAERRPHLRLRRLEQPFADELERGRIDAASARAAGPRSGGGRRGVWPVPAGCSTSSARCGVTSLPPFAIIA